MMNWVLALHSFFFPQVCVVCSNLLKRSEADICLLCESALPVLPYKFGDGNPIEQLFYNRVDIKGANAFLSFIDAGKTQKIVHAIKYQSRTELALLMGKLASNSTLLNTPDFKPDLIIPVQMHQSKLLKRGFNQSDFIANGMAMAWQTNIDNTCVKRIVNTNSQTKMRQSS